MENIEFAQKAFIVREDRLLLIRKSPSSPCYPEKWEVPGGRLRQLESLADGLRREVYEEVGLHIRSIEPFALWDWTIRQKNEHIRVIAVAHYCHSNDGAPTLKHQSPDDYIDRCKWVPVAELPNYEFIPDFIPIIKIFLKKYYDS